MDKLDQNGSWFGLAISGLKFLINNQSNNNINHNLNTSQAVTSKHHSSTQKHQNKLHILGPSVFKKQLYDIPEYRSMQIKNNDKSNLTKQALKQFNGNFSNYWNQRSSLHSHHSSDRSHHDIDDDSNNSSHPTHTTQSQTTQQITDEYQPSMTSSQIIHPTQGKQKQSVLRRSRSFPLLHSAEYIQNFEQLFSTDNANDVTISTHNYDEEGSIASPPPISTTPELQNISLPHIHNVHAIKSWDSINSYASNNTSDDGIVLINNHFKQRQWLPSYVKEMESMKKKRKYSDDDTGVFSDWSNVSSNVGVKTPK